MLAPGVVAFAATAAAAGGAAQAETQAAAPPKAPQPLRVSFKRHNVLSGGLVPVNGRLLTGERGRKVLVQASSGHGWHTVARTRTRANGVFRTAFRPRDLGRLQLRVRLVGPPAGIETVAGIGVPIPSAHTASRRVHGAVTVYRESQASWYGPGLLGGRTACGGTLDSSTLGVANRSLPCGTRVTFHYRGHTVTARVIDRGPFAAGRDWDLTPAVKQRLGFPSTGTVWATA